MIRRLLPWAIVAVIAAIAFFVGSMFWRAWQLPEDLSASVTGVTDAPPAAVWLVLNTPGVLDERFDEVEFEDVVEDDGAAHDAAGDTDREEAGAGYAGEAEGADDNE